MSASHALVAKFNDVHCCAKDLEHFRINVRRTFSSYSDSLKELGTGLGDAPTCPRGSAFGPHCTGVELCTPDPHFGEGSAPQTRPCWGSALHPRPPLGGGLCTQDPGPTRGGHPRPRPHWGRAQHPRPPLGWGGLCT